MLALGANGRGRAGLLSALRPQDVFATSLYTGTGASQTINNGLDLAGKGGLAWFKSRSGANGHALFDTQRPVANRLMTEVTDAETSNASLFSSFNANGFTLGADTNGRTNASGSNYVGWSFRRASKVFDVVTYTGDGTGARTISHNLGIAPGLVLAKARSTASDWLVGMPVLTNGRLLLNTTDARVTGALITNYTDTTVTVASSYNQNNVTYVLLLWAHDPDTTNGIVQCGSYTGTGAAGKAIDTGYPVQWALVKRTDSTSDWGIMDLPRASFDAPLYANLSAAEASQDIFDTTATGLVTKSSAFNVSGGAYAYCLIRAPI